MNLKKRINILLSMKQEGEYWDFKRQWYEEGKDGDLLHDIICMANNLSDNDGLIILGIDESMDFEIVGIQNDSNRKTTQNIVDFLKNKNFIGGIRPVVVVETVKFDQGDVDVIVVKNTTKTPYYLQKQYKGVFANQIYTRIQDTNTPKNSSADIDKVEYLWKKRFGLNLTPLGRLEKFIEDYQGWVNSSRGEQYKYYSLQPEYIIRYDDEDDFTAPDGYEYYLFSQSDYRPRFKNIRIYYHQTLLREMAGVSLDGGRYFSPCPEIGYFNIDNDDYDTIFYRYYIRNSFTYRLNDFFYKQEFTHDAKIAREKFLECILIFDEPFEKNLFEDFAKTNWVNRDNFKNKIHLPHIPKKLGDGYVENAYKKEYEDALILREMLTEFRTQRDE